LRGAAPRNVNLALRRRELERKHRKPGTALQRASYREGGPERRLVKPDETVQLRMDQLVTANRLAKGHRLRVVITPQFYPLFSVHPQTGAQEFDSDSVRAGEIHIGDSRVILPMVPAK
jgi:predicted acyl esterase